MSEQVDLQNLWHRLWVQVDDPAFVTPTREVRCELAQIWVRIEALTYLRQDDSVIEFASWRIRRALAQLAVDSLTPARSITFDHGFWQSVLAVSKLVELQVPELPVPQLQPMEWLPQWASATPIDLMTDVLDRVAPECEVVAVPVMAGADQPPVRAERSRPGWRFNGRATGGAVGPDNTHCAVFAIDEGDNEVLGLVRVDAAGLTISPTGEVRCDDLDLPEADVITGVHERALLEDRLTLIGLAHMLQSTVSSVSDLADRLELALAGAVMDSAAGVVDHAQVAVRSRGVSAAVTCVQPVCVRVAGLDERFPELWHQQRLVAFL